MQIKYMKTLMITKYKTWMRLITFIIITAFLSQNIAWADGGNLLARDSKRDLEQIRELFRKNPGPEDGSWAKFSRKSGKDTGMPFQINQSRLQQLREKYNKLSLITGEIGSDNKFYFHNKKELIKQLYNRGIEKINDKIILLINKIKVFGPGTKVNIFTDGNRPLLCNKDDYSLDINGLFLLDDISDELLLFCGWHEARHKLIKGLSPLLEEVLNIYMDFEYLDNMDVQKTINLVNELEGLEVKGGYAQILRERNQRKSGQRESDKVLNKILNYIWQECPWVIEGLNIDTTQINNPEYILRRLLDEDKYFVLFVKGLRIKYEDSLGEQLPNPLQILSQVAGILYGEMAFFSDLEDGVYKICMECNNRPVSIGEVANRLNFDKKWTSVLFDIAEYRGEVYRIYTGEKEFGYLYKGVVEENVRKGSLIIGFDLELNKNIYIPDGFKNSSWAQKLIHNEKIKNLWNQLQTELNKISLDKEEKGFIKNLWGSISRDSNIKETIEGSGVTKIEHSLNIAIRMAKIGASKSAIFAGLVYKINPKNVKKYLGQSGLRRDLIEEVICFINNFNNICSVLSFEFFTSRYMIQNAINLIVQFTRGDPGVLMLAILDKIEYLRILKDPPQIYEKLTDKEKNLLKQAVEWIYIPISDFLGREDLANEMRDLYLRIILSELYKQAEEDVYEKTGLRYEDLNTVMNKITEIVNEEILKEISDVKITSRVKTTYSVYYKPKEIKDLFGIRLVIAGTHSPEELRKIRNKLDKCLGTFFIISKPDMKRLKEKKYNEYDFIAELNPEYPAFKKLLEEYKMQNLKLEVQIYPTEDDLKRYMYGPTAHWLYKLEVILKEYGISNQLFDRDILDRLYRKFREGDFNNNLRLFYNEIAKWKFIGVVNDEDGKIRIAREPHESIPPDIASALGVDLFNREYIGLRGLDERAISNTKPDGLTAGVFKVITKGKRLEVGELDKIRKNTKKPRAYLLASQMLGIELSKEEGKEILDSYLKRQKGKITSKYLENNLFVIMDKNLQNIGLTYRAFSVGSLDEFYKILHLVSKEGEKLMLQELISRTYNYMTGDILSKSVDLNELRQRLRIKENQPNMEVLLYLFTIAERGKNYLAEQGFSLDKGDNKIKLLAIMDEFGVENLEQLYGMIGVNKLLARIIVMRLENIKPPHISIETKFPEEIMKDINDIKDRSGLEMGIKTKGEKIKLLITPGRYWLERMDVVLQELRSLEAVDNAELVYEELLNVPIQLNLKIEYTRINEVEPVLEDLFKKLGVIWNIQKKEIKSRKGSFIYKLKCSENVNAKELEKIIREWLSNKLKEGYKIKKIEVKYVKKQNRSGVVLSVLTLFIPYLLGSAGSFGMFEYIILAIYILVCAYIGYKFYKLIMKKLFKEILDKLVNVCKRYEDEEIEETKLLDLFYKEHVFTPGGINFEEILRGLTMRWVANVEIEGENLEGGFPGPKINQGYIINGKYNGEIYQFFVLGDWEDIAYGINEGEYISLGKEILKNVEEILKDGVGSYRMSKKKRALKRLLIVPMRNREILESFSKNNIVASSVFSRFPKTDYPYPSFDHNKYLLMKGNLKTRALYLPKTKDNRGVIGRSFIELIGGLDALHELCHGIFDYDEKLRSRILEHFKKHPNKKLEETIGEIYNYNIYNAEDKPHIINEAFAYTLSEFAGMSRPWRELDELFRKREEMSGKTVQEIAVELGKEIEKKIDKYELSGGYIEKEILRELKNIRKEIWGLFNKCKNDWTSEGIVRTRYYEIAKNVMELTQLPAIRLLDVKFFASAELIEPWMNPLELGYSWQDVGTDDSYVDKVYYIKLIEFLIERTKAVEQWYKSEYTGEWINAPYGKEALDHARRLGWELIKTSYGIADLSDLEDKGERDAFWNASEVISIWKGIAEAELGGNTENKFKHFFASRKENARRKKRLNDFMEIMEGKEEYLVKGFITREPWVKQAFFEEVILEKPKVLIMDAQVLNELDENARTKLNNLIGQIKGNKGKAVLVSSIHVNKDERFDSIYIRHNESISNFAEYVWQDIQDKFRVNPEDIVAFTNIEGMAEFKELWRRFLKEGLFYIMDKKKSYITSTQLHFIQEITGKSIISVKPGESIELLPEELYKGVIEKALQDEIDRGA